MWLNRIDQLIYKYQRQQKFQMRKLVAVILFVLSLNQSLEALKLTHQYYSLETAELVDESQSILELNKCKTQCLQMKDFFPFSFRYHRLIIRQTTGMVKYFIGNCQVKMLNDTYQQWAKLKDYIDTTTIFGDSDYLNKGQQVIWSNYRDVCEDDKLMLSQQMVKSLDLQRHHSNFYYYDDGSFKNQEPFDDIGTMLANLNSQI